MSAIDAVVIGCSAGGLEALQQVLRLFPAGLGVPVVIVSHTAPDGIYLLPQLLGRICALPVAEAEEGEPVLAGHVYLASPNYHLLIEPDRRFALSTDPKVCNVRPAIDVLFVSAADAFRGRLAGIVLTGANADGARGLRAVAEAGGFGLVQDPLTAFADAMPRAAIASVPTAKVLPLPAIAGEVIALCRP